MRALPNSMIAQLLYADETYLNFARLVGEIDLHLARHCDGSHRLGWDSDEVAWFDIGNRRILIARADPAPEGYCACLTVAAGPAPYDRFARGEACIAADPRKLCAQLVESVLRHNPTDTIVWQESSAPLDAELVDALIEMVPPRAEIDAITGADKAAADLGTRKGQAANSRPHLPAVDLEKLHRVRAALYNEDETGKPLAEAPSTQLRLATHALNCTLLVVYMPVGAAMMTYSMLRGENFSASARAMALTAATLGFIQSGFGSQLTALL